MAAALGRALASSAGAPVTAGQVIAHLDPDRTDGRPTPLMVELLLENAATDPRSVMRVLYDLGDPEPRYGIERDASATGPCAARR